MKKFLLILILAASSLSVKAQKATIVQTDGMPAPANLKIDGKPNEWDTKLMTYNAATGFYYTMANDANFLYIVIRAKDQDIINRLLSGGLTVSAGGAGDSENGQVGFTFPISTNRSVYFDFRDAKRGVKGKALDSMIMDFNSLLQVNYKWIKVNGLPELGNTVSIYNDVDLKAAHTLDTKSVYTCELAIGLKYFGLTAGTDTKFKYHMTVNGSQARFLEPPSVNPTVPRNSDLYGKAAVENIAYQNQARFRNLILRYPTDFWGEYRLAK